jgi:thiamine biosynthesis lipoprotein
MKDSDDSLKLVAGSLAIIASVLSLTSCKKNLKMYEESRSLMGTFATITVYASDEESGIDAINAAFARIEDIESKASIFDEQAEAFQLNQDGYLDNPSDDLLELITMSLDYSQITDGYFDITVQPLLDLWGAGELWKESEEVQQNRIDETMEIIGWDKIVIEDNRIYFELEGMKITLGGIAKGYAADEALKVLQDKGIKHALVNIGGDMSALGSKPGGEPWRIALVNPDDTSQSLATFLFSDKSITTSGNYERYFDPDKQVHHILNPKTGYSANECISVTIIAENGTQADILATSVFVIGPEDGLDLVESLDSVECFIVDANRVMHQSSGLSDYLSEDQ